MQLWPECSDRCHEVYKSVQMPHQASCTQAVGIRDLFTFIHVFYVCSIMHRQGPCTLQLTKTEDRNVLHYIDHELFLYTYDYCSKMTCVSSVSVCTCVCVCVCVCCVCVCVLCVLVVVHDCKFDIFCSEGRLTGETLFCHLSM